MGKIGGILLAALIVATASSSPVAAVEPVANVQPATSAQADMLTEIRPHLTTLKASDADLISEAYGACINLVFRDKVSYREGVMKQYADVNLAVDHLTVAAAAKHYLCR